MSPTQELENLRFIEANLRARIADLEQQLAAVRRSEAVIWGLWCDEVRPGWHMWRVRRRREALELTVEARGPAGVA